MEKHNSYEKEKGKKSIQITEEIANKLAKGKTPIKIQNGVAKIDPSHPDYKYWMGD